MKRPIFTGLCTALVPPFFEGKVNFPMLEVLLQRQMEAVPDTDGLTLDSVLSAELADVAGVLCDLSWV